MINGWRNLNYWIMLIPILLASIFKSLPPFYESLDERVITAVPQLLISLNSLFIVLSLSVGIIFLFFSFQKGSFKNIPKLSNGQVLFLFLKVYLLSNSLLKSDNTSWLIEDVSSFIILIFIAFFVKYCVSLKQSKNSFLEALYIIAVVFVILNFYEMIVNFSAVGFGGRFFGLTPQPNTVGIYSSIFSIVFLWKMGKANHNVVKVSTGIFFMLTCFFVFASGSRASLAVLIIGIMIFYSPTLSASGLLRTIAVLIFFIVIVMLVYQEQVSEYFYFERLINMTDTRIETKEIFWQAFASSPITGVGNFTDATANSYFVITVKGGIIAAIILVLAIAVTLFRILVSFRKNMNSGNYRCFLALFFMLSAGGFYEGYLIDNFSLTSIVYFILIGLLSEKYFKNVS